MENDIRIRKFAIKYNPATLVIEYQNNHGLFLKKIRIKIGNNKIVLHFKYFFEVDILYCYIFYMYH